MKSAERVENKWKEGGAQSRRVDVLQVLVTLRLYASLMGRLTSFKVLALRYCSWIGEMTVRLAKINVMSFLMKSGFIKTRTQQSMLVVLFANVLCSSWDTAELSSPALQSFVERS